MRSLWQRVDEVALEFSFAVHSGPRKGQLDLAGALSWLRRLEQRARNDGHDFDLLLMNRTYRVRREHLDAALARQKQKVSA